MLLMIDQGGLDFVVPFSRRETRLYMESPRDRGRDCCGAIDLRRFLNEGEEGFALAAPDLAEMAGAFLAGRVGAGRGTGEPAEHGQDGADSVSGTRERECRQAVSLVFLFVVQGANPARID